MIETSVNEQIAVALDALRLKQARRVTEHLTVGASAGRRDAAGMWSQYQPTRDWWRLIELGRAARTVDNEHLIRARCRRAQSDWRNQTQARGRR